MRIKRYVGWDVQSTFKRIRAELGPDAVILRVKKLPWPHPFRAFLRDRAEVVAAVGPDIPAAEPQAKTLGMAATPEGQARGTAINVPVLNDPPSIDSVSNSIGSDPLASLRDDLAEIKSTLKVLSLNGSEAREGAAKGTAKWLKSGKGREFYQILLDQDVDEELAGVIMQEAFGSQKAKGKKTDERKESSTPETQLEEIIRKIIQTGGPIDLTPGQCKAVILVGPTGVGKTTTIAKLAAHLGVISKKKVSLITADTYRVAAVDQLKTYAEIMGMDLRVVHTPQEMRAAINEFSGSDLILVDTAGRSPKNTLEIGELKAMVDAARPGEVHLVLSVATKPRDLLDIVARFSPVGIDSIIFTKLDETSYLGGLLTVAHKTGKPISYVTTGQSVPEDIAVADASHLAKSILSGGSHERPSRQLATNS